MSLVTKPLVLNETFAEKMDRQNALLGALVRDRVVQDVMSWDAIRAIVMSGSAPDVFRTGDQITTQWTDESGKVWDAPLDVVHFGNVELPSGDIVPGMYLQWHYTTPYGIPFNMTNAIYYAAEGLEPGTYHVTAANGWGNNIVSGESYSFTLASPVPAGGQIVFSTGTVDNTTDRWRVSTYAGPKEASPIESNLPVTVGVHGVYLGSWSSSTAPDNDPAVSAVCHMHRSNYGYNRWSTSAMRQWLNSSGDKGSWWEPQTKFDRTFTEATSKRGFLAGFTEDFLSVLRPVKVVTATNTVEKLTSDRDVTYDTFFLPSLEQEYIAPQIAGVEGEFWEYWKKAKGLDKPQAWHLTIVKECIRYGIDNKAAQNCRLRSAYRGSAYNTFYVGTAGNVSTNYACSANRCAPACVIC